MTIARIRAGSLTTDSPPARGLCLPASSSVAGSVTLQPWNRRSPLHHVPDLQAALARVKGLLAPGGRIVLADPYPAESALHPVRRVLHRLVPLRLRLRAMAVLRLGVNLVRRGPATAWEICRLSTRREWLDHLVSDRFFSREELDQCCATLFPDCQLEQLGGAVVGLTWDSTL
jgi:SAM-dependent methyltransferase